MASAVNVELRPSRGRMNQRIGELTASNPVLAARVRRLQEFSRGVRTAQVFLTNNCNIRCKGCWFFSHDLDKGVNEIRDVNQIRVFAERLKRSRISHVLLLGGEPTLVVDRVIPFVETLPYVTVVTNGIRRLPLIGFENVTVAVSVFGGGPVDDQLRAIRPNGSRFEGIFEKALLNYRNDQRAVWIYSISEEGMPYVEDTVRRIVDNGNQVNFGFYSSYDTDDPVGLVKGRELLDASRRVLNLYPNRVISHPYYLETMITGRTHWGTFGYDTCPSISWNHPAHAERKKNGNPVLPGFNTYRADHSVQFCCTSGNCAGCRDSQAVYSWLLVSMHHFLESEEQLTIWVEIAERFFQQFRWSPYHPSNRVGHP